MRWLVLDEVIAVERQKRALSRSRIPAEKYSAEFLMIEMMAQTAALLVGVEKDFSEDMVFAKIESAVFEPGLIPGEEIEIEASSDQIRPEGGWMDAEIRNSRGRIAKSRFLLMCVGHLIPGSSRPVTFHEAFMNHFQIRTKIK
jgi:hypothetical protein